MIQENELRIGNLVQDSFGLIEISIRGQSYFNNEDNNLGTIEFASIYKPIPLTEEWLLKFGFVSNPYQDRYEKYYLHIQCNKTKGYLELWIDLLPHIKYVHQLQNLCYLMFNEELTISQP